MLLAGSKAVLRRPHAQNQDREPSFTQGTASANSPHKGASHSPSGAGGTAQDSTERAAVWPRLAKAAGLETEQTVQVFRY